MLSCLTVFAIVPAVVALVMVFRLRTEVRELRQVVASLRGEQPVPSVPPPAAAPVKPAEPAITFYAPPAEPASADTHPFTTTPVTPGAAPAPVPPGPIASPRGIDWENLVGIRLFSWIAGIALVLAAVFLFKYSVDHGWLRPAIRAALGLITGVGLLAACEMRVARNYRFTANALDGAGIAILYATLFALHARWDLWPAAAAFGGMLVVTAIAVLLATRRDSVFIALLGLIGGFATPALLSSGENRPIALFSYLLLLNGGISWIAWRKRWPLLTGLSVVLTAVYQWAWVERFLTTGQLPLAASIFVLFALVGVSSLLTSTGESERRTAFGRIAAAAAVLPLLFAFFTAIVPEYGAQYHVLFGFLLLISAGLGAIALWRGPEWLHLLGGGATVVTFFIWLTVSYTHQAWPWSLAWLGAFIVLYLATATVRRTAAVYTSSLLFGVFIGFAVREPAHAPTLIGALLSLLVIVVVFALRSSMPHVCSISIAFASIAVMAMDTAPAWMAVGTQVLLLAVLLALAWISSRPLLVLLAVPFIIAAVIAAHHYSPGAQLLLAGALYALILGYAFYGGPRLAGHLSIPASVALTSGVFFVTSYVHETRTSLGYDAFIGLIPLVMAAVVLLVLYRMRRGGAEDEGGLTSSAILASTSLALLTAAIAVQLEKEWITIAFALEAAALAWLFRRIPHRGLLAWSAGLVVAVLVRLVLNPAVFDYHQKSDTPIFNWYLYTYGVSGGAMFALVRLLPQTEHQLRRFAAAVGTIVLFVLLNIQIADIYATGSALTFNFGSASLAQELTYTIGWAVFAMVMLAIGILIGSRAARIAALGLLLLTILKCFLHDLAALGGLYRVGSLFGLAVSLVLVGLLLQKFVILKREPPTDASVGPAG